MRRTSSTFAVAALAWAAVGGGCHAETDPGADASEQAPAVVRLSPAGVSTGDAWRLFDRSVSSAFTPTPTPVQISLDHEESIAAVKVYGPAPYRFRVAAHDGISLGLESIDLSALSPGWHVFPATAGVSTSTVELRFDALGAPGPVPEIELWATSDAPIRPVDLSVADLPRGFVAFAAKTDHGELAPAACAAFQVELTRPPSQLRRAHLVYEAHGVLRSFSIGRSINGVGAQGAQGGSWLAADPSAHTFADEIDPASLQSGTNELRLCLPAEATQNVTIDHLRVVGGLDRGVGLATTAAIGADARDATQLVDGSGQTPITVGPGERLALGFDRLIAPDALTLSGSFGEVAIDCVDRRGHASALTATRTGAVFQLSGGAHTCRELGVTFKAHASLTAVDVIGSGAADPVDWARLVITSAKEHFGNLAWVSGFVARPSIMTGAIRVDIDGIAAESLTGDFGRLLSRSSDIGVAWTVPIAARLPDGTTQSKQLVLDLDQRAQLTRQGAQTASATTTTAASAALAGKVGDSVLVRADSALPSKIRLGTHVGVDVPAGALTHATDITVRHLGDTAVPPLDAGMVNVTAPKGHGFEFLPHGQRFAKPVQVVVPYDPTLIPEGMSENDVHTYYFDPAAEKWKPLERQAIDIGEHVALSATDHFTIMIDAVLAVPKNPAPLSFDPTALSSIGAASPATNIDLIAPPQATSTGDARTALPIRIPAGRGAYTPSAAIAYSSSAGNGWLGVGWDLSLPRVEIDTRWGVPTYATGEEPRYLLDGAEIVPTLETDGPSCEAGTVQQRYHARIEGAFAHILRCSATVDGASTHFEVHDRDGTLFVYGSESAGDTSNASLTDPQDPQQLTPHRISRWNLRKVVDVHGNATLYQYAYDDITTGQPSREVYPVSIAYTSHPSKQETPFTVEFQLDDSTNPRPDPIISGRSGFKTTTRHLLRAVHVKYRGTIIRDYVLTYANGEFDKSVLDNVKVYGIGGCAISGNAFAAPTCSGALLDTHSFEYFQETPGFTDAVAWKVQDDPDPSNATLTQGGTATVSANIGAGYGPPGETVGASVNGSFGGREELVGLYDMNGDGLPDQVFDTSGGGFVDDIFGNGNGSIAVLYNQTRPGIGSSDPLFAASGPIVSGLPALGAELQGSWGGSLSGTYSFANASVGFSSAASRARRAITDLDGDGFLDIVNPGAMSLFGAPCPSGQCFGQRPFGAPSGIDPRNDPILQGLDNALKTRLPLADPVVQWIAPFDGTVTVTGTAHKLGAGGEDGVSIEAYHQDDFLAGLALGPENTDSVEFPAPTTVDVSAGEAIYLRVKTGSDDGIAPDGSLSDLVDARLHVAYVHACTVLGCSPVPDASAAKEPTGAPVFAFDSDDDLRVAGMPTPLVVLGQGTLQFHAVLVKQPALADVRVCVQLFAPSHLLTNKSLDRPCSAGDSDVTNLSGTTTLSAESSVAQPLDVSAAVIEGQALMVRVESDLSFDPERVSLVPASPDTPLASYSQVCLPIIAGNAYECSTAPSVIASVPIQLAGFGPFVPISSEPPAVPFVSPQDGLLTVEPFPTPLGPFVFAIRSDRQGVVLYQDCTAVSCSGMTPPTTFQVVAGESISLEIATTSGAGVFPTVAVDYGNPSAPISAPLIQRTIPAPTRASPFVGGYRGFRFGFWNEANAFAPATLLSELFDPLLQQALAQQIAQTIFVPTPSFGGSGIVPGGAPAWLGPQSAAFISASGLEASWLGMLPNGSAATPADRGGLFAANFARVLRATVVSA